jgi:hypothetical protein
VFGKLCQSAFRYRNFHVVTSPAKFNRLTAQMYLKNVKRISEKVSIIEMKRRQVKLNRPILAAFQVLELSKLLMYITAYVDLEQAFARDNMRLLFTDTDSFLFQLLSMEKNPFLELLKIKHILDTSCYPEDHILYKHTEDKDKLGLHQIETSPCQIVHKFVGLRSKQYYIQVYNFRDGSFNSVKRAKGVTKAAQKSIELSHFKKCVFDRTITRADQVTIRSYNTKLFTIKTNRQILNSLDLKRYVLADGINTLPFGHYRIAELES